MNRSTFLLLGPEGGEKERFIAGLRASLEKSAGGELETSSYYPYDTSMADIVSAMRNGSLFSSDKLVKISNIEDLKKEGLDALIDYVKAPASGVTLLLLSDQVQVNERLKKAVGKEGTKIFWELFENQKQRWIASFFRDRNITIDDEAAELLLDLVDNNTIDLRGACERLVLFYGEGSRLSAEDVENQIYHSKEENVFSLFAKLAVGDLAGSLDICVRILESGSGQAVQLLGGLIWQFRRLHSLRLMLDSNFSRDEALAKAGVRGKRNGELYLRGAANFSAPQLGEILALQARYDALLRSTPAEAQRHILSMFIYFVAARKGHEEEPVAI